MPTGALHADHHRAKAVSTQGFRSDLGRGVVVLGMHRSGTSAVTGAIDALGLPACRTEDRFPVREPNPRGNYESSSLSWFDEELLRELGGRWWSLPLPRLGWAHTPGIDEWRSEASALFAAAHPSGQWVWKDPRACVLLPFWDLVLGPGVPRVVVLRNPAEIAASLHARDNMPLEQALALTERSLRTCLRDSVDRPVFITSYDDLLASPSAWSERCAEFLRGSGLELPEPLAVDAVAAFLEPSLRHHREPPRPARADPAASGLTPLLEWVTARTGIHGSLSIEGLPDETPSTDRILRSALSPTR